MLRTLVLAGALFASPAALACGGAPCSGNCSMKHAPTAAVDTVDEAAGTKLTLSVSGMTCGVCAGKVTAALKGLDGVNAVFVDHEKGTAKVAFDAEKVKDSKLVETINGLGYTAKKPEA